MIECESKKSLQGVSIDHIIHLSMEKCLLGTMVHLAFQIDTPSRKSTQTPRGSPVLLQNVSHIPTKISRISDFGSNCKIPELLASGIIEISNGKRVRRVIDIFMECINCFAESRWISSDRNIKFSFNADDTRSEHSVKHTSNKIVLQETSSSENKVELIQLLNTTQPENTGIDLVLSMSSSDDESRENSIFISDQLPGEREAKEDRNEVSDSECELDDSYKENNSVFLGTSSSDFMGNINLSDIQQSILCAPDSDISKIWTSIGVTDHDKLESASKNDHSSTVVVNTIANHLSCSKSKKCSCLTTNASLHFSVPKSYSTSTVSVDEKAASSKGAFLAGTANCKAEDSQIFVPNSSSNFEDDALFESPSSEDLDAFLAQFNLSYFSKTTGENDGEVHVTQLCDEENCICSRCYKADEMSFTDVNVVDENSRLPCKNRSRDFKSSKLNGRTCYSSSKVGSFDPTIRPPCSKTVNIQGSYKCFCSKGSDHAIEHIGTPELFSSRSIQRSQPCLSSTPISQLQNNYSKSRLFLRKPSLSRKTKHLNSSFRGDVKQSKKKSGTLWKCLRNVDKNLIPCTVTSSHSDVSFDEKRESLEVSSVLLLEDSPVSTSCSVSLIQQSETVTEDALPFESEMEPDDNKEKLTRSKTVDESIFNNSLSTFTEYNNDKNFLNLSVDQNCEYNISDTQSTNGNDVQNCTFDSPLLFSQS